MHIENQNVNIVFFDQRRKALVLLKRELFISDIVFDVIEELNNVAFSGMVVFDMLLTKGIEDRFYNMRFENSVFDYKTNVLSPNPTAEIKKISKNYYKTHLEFINHTSLTPKQKEKIVSWVYEV